MSSYKFTISSLFICVVFVFFNRVLGMLDPLKMRHHLESGQPILGSFSNPGTPMTSWMDTLDDQVTIEQINIPGTHDTSAWNFTGPVADTVNTQDRAIFHQLNAGIRFLDIRFGLDENTNVLRVYHGDALLSATATLEDVLWGLYHFLDNHPSETLLVSLKVDHGSVSVPVQEGAHALITGEDVRDYWVQSTTLPTKLCEARRKIILVRRFGFDTVNNPDLIPVGLDVATGWVDNDADFSITYATGQTVYIEDLYQLNGDVDQVSAAQKVERKFEALQTHIGNAQAAANASQLFITFASGFGAGLGDTLTPKVLAVGNKTAELVGINKKIDEWLTGNPNQRLGIVLYDFFESQPNLIHKTIGSRH